MNTSIIQSENSNKTVHAGDNQFSKLETDDIETESTDQQSTDSQSENSVDKKDVASPKSNEETSVTEGEQSSGST